MTIALDVTPRPAAGVTRSGAAEDGSLTLGRADGELVVLNDTASALWALCDGQTTVAEIVRAATHLFGASESTIEADIRNALEDLRQRNLIVC